MAASAQIKAVSWQHEALADLMLTEPHLSLGDCAKRLGFTLAWLSVVKNSDSFKDYWALRRLKHNEGLTVGIREKAAALAELTLDVLLEDTQTKVLAGAMSSAEARETLDLVSKRFGFDGTVSQQKNQPAVVLNVGIVPEEALAAAREKMRRVQVQEETTPVPLIADKA